jgi:hypothetical protein
VINRLLARWLSLPKALQIEKQQLAEQTAAGKCDP